MPAPNQRVGEYVLQDRIAAGTFGEVWRAQHHVWRDQVVGWANASVRNGRLRVAAGYVDGAPRDPAFKRELADERARMAEFLEL